MKKNIFFLSILFLSVVLTSCSSKVVFDERHEFSNYKWNNFDPITFKVEIKEIKDPYSICLNMRHITQMPYTTLRVLVEIKTPSGSIRSFPHIFKIRDNEGNFLGEGMGDIWDIEGYGKRQFFFNEVGQYEFTIKNHTQNYENVGIMSLGLKIKKTKIDTKKEESLLF